MARDISRISGALATRRQNIANSIHNFQLVSTELGNRDQDVVNFVDSSNAVLASFAKEQASIRSAVQQLPGTLKETKGALKSANSLALQSGPALKKLIPGAQATGPALRALRPFFQETAGPIQNQIRPFTQQIASPVQHVAQIGQGLGVATPGLKTGFTRLNDGLNSLAYNPTRRCGGLPLLRPVAEPRPDRQLHAAGRLRADPRAASCRRAAAPRRRPSRPCSLSPTCASCTN